MKNLILVLFSFCAIALNAQDVIYKKDNTKIDAKVIEVGVLDVKYKPATNPEGPVYVLFKADISTIVFQNGTFEVFSPMDRPSRRRRSDSLSVNFCRNSIGIDIGEFTNSAVGITYEHTFGKKGMWAIRLPFAVGISPYNRYNYNWQKKIFSVGLDFLYFPTGQGKFRYYAAPYFEWGMYNYMNYYYTDYSSSGYYYPNYYYKTGHRFSGGVKNGILFQPTRHFAVSADLGIGIQGGAGNYYQQSIQPQVRGNLIIGYKF